MTGEQINAAIARALHADEHWMIQKNYCADLNAMHEAEKTLMQKAKWVRYSEQLAKVTNAECSADTAYICAPARQRAEAFLRALGKWEVL
jgi:hypothetical protein